jgi:hypothetical protein
MWDHVQAKLNPTPLHSPFVSKSLIRDSKGAGARGRCWSYPASCAPAEFSHGSDPSNMPAPLSYLTGHPSLERIPLSEHQSQRCHAQQQRSLGGGGGRGEGTKERRWSRRGGGGGGEGGKRMCCILKYLLSEKNYKAVTLESPHISFGWLQLLMHSWSVALSRIDSRWKKSAYLPGTRL